MGKYKIKKKNNYYYVLYKQNEVLEINSNKKELRKFLNKLRG